MTNQELRDAQDAFDKGHEHGERVDKLANRIEKEILADPETFAEHVLNKDDFINAISALVCALPDDDAELGMLIRALYKAEAVKAADWEADKRMETRSDEFNFMASITRTQFWGRS